MDQREAMTLPGSASYYVHRGTDYSVLGVQGPPSMNSLSNPTILFQSNTRGSLIGSELPLDTSSTLSAHRISVGPPPATLQGEPIRRKRGRPRKYGRNGAVSLALSPSTSSPVPIVRPTQKRRGRPPGTGRKQQLVSLGEAVVNESTGLFPHVISIAAGEDVRGRLLAFLQGRGHVVMISAVGYISAVNLRDRHSGGITALEGHFLILNLSVSYTHNGGATPEVGYLNLILAQPDGSVIGGQVEGAVIAARPFEMIVAIMSPHTPETNDNVGETPETSNPEDRPVGNLVAPDNA